jgi:hypothetical protein
LLCILEEVGPEFFIEDKRRLAVSKGWYRVAWRVLARDPVLKWRSLRRFTSDAGLCRDMRPYMKSLTLSLGHKKERRYSSGCPWDREELLTAAAAKLRQCAAPPKLSIVFWEMPAQLRELASSGLLRLRHLTSLEIDGMDRFDDLEIAHNRAECVGCHINRLLPTLRRLRCRLYPFCPKLLGLPQAVIRKDKDLPLEELIINLDYHAAVSRSQFCYHWYQWRADGQPIHPPNGASVGQIRMQATMLAWYMARPKMVRVMVWDGRPAQRKVRAFDALTGRWSLLPAAGYEWDDAGEPADPVVDSDWDDTGWQEEVRRWLLVSTAGRWKGRLGRRGEELKSVREAPPGP